MANDAVNRYLEGIKGKNYLVGVDWEQWLKIEPPYPEVGFDVKEVAARFHRNGYDWDIHGRLYTPEKEIDPSIHGFELFTKAMQSKAPPALAPAILAQFGLLGLVCTYRATSKGEKT